MESVLQIELAKKCKERRLQREMSGRCLSRYLQIHPSNYNRFERGEKPLGRKNLAKVLTYFGFEVRIIVVGDAPDPIFFTCPKCLARHQIRIKA